MVGVGFALTFSSSFSSSALVERITITGRAFRAWPRRRGHSRSGRHWLVDRAAVTNGVSLGAGHLIWLSTVGLG